MGKSVVLISPDIHLGGLSSGGLGYTDTGNNAVIGGLSRDPYHRVWKEYQMPETWKWLKPEEVRKQKARRSGDRWQAAHHVDFPPLPHAQVSLPSNLRTPWESVVQSSALNAELSAGSWTLVNS